MDVKNKALNDLCLEYLDIEKEIEKTKTKIKEWEDKKSELEKKMLSKFKTISDTYENKYGLDETINLDDVQLSCEKNFATNTDEFDKKDMNKVPQEYLKITTSLNKDNIRKEFMSSKKENSKLVKLGIRVIQTNTIHIDRR